MSDNHHPMGNPECFICPHKPSGWSGLERPERPSWALRLPSSHGCRWGTTCGPRPRTETERHGGQWCWRLLKGPANRRRHRVGDWSKKFSSSTHFITKVHQRIHVCMINSQSFSKYFNSLIILEIISKVKSDKNPLAVSVLVPHVNTCCSFF